MIRISKRQAGFTLVELLVSMAVAGIVMAAVYSSYYSQQKSYVTQEQVAQMQQNLRAAMYHLEREIRMAGYDPKAKNIGKIVTPNADSIQFTKDENSNGVIGNDSNEDITFRLEADALHAGRNNLVRRIPTVSGAQSHVLAEGIDALNFVYLDENGTVTASTNLMRSIQISVVARTARQDPGYTDTATYTNHQGATIYTPAGNDTKFRRNMLRAEVRCRNLGL